MRFSLIVFFAIFSLLVSCGNSSDEDQATDDNGADSLIVIDSLSYYKKKLNADPNNPGVKFERAKYYVRQGDVELAVEI